MKSAEFFYAISNNNKNTKSKQEILDLESKYRNELEEIEFLISSRSKKGDISVGYIPSNNSHCSDLKSILESHGYKCLIDTSTKVYQLRIIWNFKELIHYMADSLDLDSDRLFKSLNKKI